MVSFYQSEFHQLYSGSHPSVLKDLILSVISCEISELKKEDDVLFCVTVIQYNILIIFDVEIGIRDFF